MNTLIEILSMKRPHRGENEARVATEILSRLPYGLEVFRNARQEAMAFVICTDPESTTLFTAHLDTVHKYDGPNPVVYDPEMGWMSKADGEALGADDGAGVWVLYKMIEAGVPGTYLFPLGEECGGVGAKWMAENAASWLERFDRAVAFDRAGTGDVITHQEWHGRCCSDDFAEALSAQLNASMDLCGNEFYDGFRPDDTGVYTDTAEFTGVIPECTNLSVGYKNQHGGKESLDVTFVKMLAAAACKVDWDSLPAVRDPKEVDEGLDWYTGYSGYGGTSYQSAFHADLTLDTLRGMDETEIYYMVQDETELVAEFLTQLRDQITYDDTEA